MHICTDGQLTPQKLTSHVCLNTAVWTAWETLTKKLHTPMDTMLKFQIHAAISLLHMNIHQYIRMFPSQSCFSFSSTSASILFSPIFNSYFCKGHVKKNNPFCLWSKFAWIPDNTVYVTWQFPCLNLMWCQAGWNRSILENTEPFMKVSLFYCLTPKTHVKQACYKMQI